MRITLKSNLGYELIFEFDNIKIAEDIEERIYPTDKNGKKIFQSRPKRDISSDVLQEFVSILGDMIFYRKAEFNSSDLIELLFTKLPEKDASKLISALKRDYDTNTQID